MTKKRDLEIAREATRIAGNAILAYPAKNIPRDLIKGWFSDKLKAYDKAIVSSTKGGSK